MDGGAEMIESLPSANRHATLRQRRIPASGNSALAASALIQAALGIEFTLSGLNKLFAPDYVGGFTAFVRTSPGATSGLLSPIVQALVLPHLVLVAYLVEFSELLLGAVLLIGAIEVARRRFSGALGAAHGYEAPVALVAALAGLAAAGLALSIFLLMGGVLPTIMPNRAFTTAIPVELLLVRSAWPSPGSSSVVSAFSRGSSSSPALRLAHRHSDYAPADDTPVRPGRHPGKAGNGLGFGLPSGWRRRIVARVPESLH
jgi:hypothetical protein